MNLSSALAIIEHEQWKLKRACRPLVSIDLHDDGFHVSRLGDSRIFVLEDIDSALRKVRELLFPIRSQEGR